MKKGLLLLVLGFTLGFFVHALFLPDLFANGIFILPQASTLSQQASNVSPANQVSNETKITYDGSHFSRTNVRVERSRYLSITNVSQTAVMDLISSEEGLNTPRPYAYTEQIRTRMDQPGTYIVTDRNNSTNRLVITVK